MSAFWTSKGSPTRQFAQYLGGSAYQFCSGYSRYDVANR